MFLKHNQSKLRIADYQSLVDAIEQNEDLDRIGKVTILPSTFIGGYRWFSEMKHDGYALVKFFGKPDLFITFTCNLKWEEIQRELRNQQSATDRQDLIARVFHLKVNLLMDVIVNKQIFGKIRSHMRTFEWQKRGLPHVHILLWMEDRIDPDEIDNFISAEIPDEEFDPELFRIVTTFMLHGPCGHFNPHCTCMVDGQCSKEFPKELRAETQMTRSSYPLYRRRSVEDGGRQVEKGQFVFDNQWVVPYCPFLSRLLNAHVNVEYCRSIKSVKYLCKYVTKGQDMAVFQLAKRGQDVDEIQDFRHAR